VTDDLKELVRRHKAKDGLLGVEILRMVDALIEEVERLRAELERANRPHRVFMLAATEEDPFNKIECDIIDVSHSEHIIVIEQPKWMEILMQLKDCQDSRDVAKAEVERLRKALESIARHPHNAYQNDKVGCDDSLSYSTGVTDGHRCAAKVARKALGEDMDE